MVAADPSPLFHAFPALAAALPRVDLGGFPTPVERPEALATELRLPGLYLKRDDHCGRIYGSNKVRKLEFLLGDAVRRGARSVFTLGFAGSNHALATACCARELGLGCTSLLLPQPPAPYVAHNLLAGLGCGARLLPCANLAMVGLHWLRLRPWALFIPAGGSSPRGAVAYVNAAFELREQIRQGLLPEPERIYLPFSSMGTAAGLSIGLQVAGLSSRIEAVRVIERRWATPASLRKLLRATLGFLRRLDPAFPTLPELGANLTVREDCLGPGYALATAEGEAATELARRFAGLELNRAYTAKAFAALICDGRTGRLGGRPVLYWNTYNNRDLRPLIGEATPSMLPTALRCYCEQPA